MAAEIPGHSSARELHPAVQHQLRSTVESEGSMLGMLAPEKQLKEGGRFTYAKVNDVRWSSNILNKEKLFCYSRIKTTS
jgi:hypothetical protein